MNSRLDLKYRPIKFSDVLGNDVVVQLLKKRSISNTLSSQSMLFSGPKGTGKTTLARIVSMSLVCKNKLDGEPCGLCDECISIINGNSYVVEELDAASQGTVDKIREMIRDSEYETTNGIGSVYILDESQRLSAPAQDALLKAIEDRSIIVIMCTTEPHKIKSPIRSRLEEYPIYTPNTDEVVSRLRHICDNESIKYEVEALNLLVNVFERCPRICIRSIETLSIMGGVSIENVKKLTRFDSYGMVDFILNNIDSDPIKSIDVFDKLIDLEGSIWVRDTMLFAISSAIRCSIGANSKYPCSVNFFKNRGNGWSEFSNIIGIVEKPTSSFLLSSLISSASNSKHCSKSIDTKPTDAEPIDTKPIDTKPIDTKPADPKLVEDIKVNHNDLEIDGVKFSSEENLTSLDSKISSHEDPSNTEKEKILVEYKTDKEPMPYREFSREFINRFRK